MPVSFYLRRFALAFAIASISIAAAQLLKGHALALAVPDALLWGAITGAVFTGVLAWKLRRAACRNDMG